MREAAGPTDELVHQAQGGDARSYEQLFERVAERVLLFVKIRLGAKLRDRLDPFDVLQETYLEAHRSFPTFEPQGEGAFLRWIYRIADNRLRNLADHYGAKKRGSERAQVRTPEVIERIRASHTGPSTAIARQEEHGRLLEAMGRLAAEEREALLMRYFHDATLEEIATASGRSLSAVRRLLARAEIRLGASLREEPGVD